MDDDEYVSQVVVTLHCSIEAFQFHPVSTLIEPIAKAPARTMMTALHINNFAGSVSLRK